MTSPKTASEFVQVLEQASLIAPVHLQRVRSQIPAPNSPGCDSLSFAKGLVKEGLLTPFQAKRLMAGRREGFFIGKYRLLDVLGQGGMGRVYLAEQITMKRAVALKLIRFGDHENPAILVRFAREARAAARLRHPNITQAFDFDQAGDYHYIAMEFIEGVTLQDWVQKSGALPWAQAAFYMAQAGMALEHANQAGLVHRDVKPGNLMVDVQGMLKLLDLGLVNIPTEDDSLTLANRDTILGTADYVAPEQAVDSHNVDTRADLYSLGGVFYFLLTGRPPFSGKSAAQKIIAHQTEELAPLTELAPDVPKRIADIVHKLMSKKPEERFQTPTELLQTLKPFAQAAARTMPPYDLSLVRFTRDSVDKYLHFGVDAPPANNVPPANFGQATMGDFRIPADALTPKPAGELAPNVVSKPVTPSTPRGGMARKRDLARQSDDPALEKQSMTPANRPTPIPPNKRVTAVRSKPDPKPPQPKPRRRSKWLWLAIFIIPNIIAVLVIVGLLGRTPQSNEPGKKSPAPTTVVIAKTDAASSLTKALAGVAGDGNILLEARSGSFTLETLTIAGKLPNRGHFTLASKDKARPVTLAALGAGPILRISNAENFLLRDVILDGQGQSGPLLEIDGRSPGVTLQNVTIRNVTGTAVSLLNAQGRPEKPLRFENVTFDMGAGVAIKCQARSFDDCTRNLELAGCSFKGTTTSVLFAAPVDGLSIRNCVFVKGTHGLRFAPSPILSDLNAIHTLADWKIAGPFDEKSLPNLDPQLSAESQPLSWKKMAAPIVDFSKGPKGTALAAAVVRTATAGPRRLFIGADDAIAVWVNGQKVFDHSDKQGYVPGVFNAMANFHSGDNHVWVKTNASQFSLDVADNYLSLTGPHWSNVKIENNLFDATLRALEFGAAPSQESMVRIMGNQFRHTLLHPLAVVKSSEPIRPGTIMAAENTDTVNTERATSSADYELLPLR